jgi:hypothetical protein
MTPPVLEQEALYGQGGKEGPGEEGRGEESPGEEEDCSEEEEVAEG